MRYAQPASRLRVLGGALATVVVLAALSVVAVAYLGPPGFVLWMVLGIVAVVGGIVSAARNRSDHALYYFATAIGMAAATLVGFAFFVWRFMAGG